MWWCLAFRGGAAVFDGFLVVVVGRVVVAFGVGLTAAWLCL